MKDGLHRWVMKSSIMRVPRRLSGWMMARGLKAKQSIAVSYKGDKRTVFELIWKIKQETDFIMADHEAFHIYSAVQRVAKVPGDIAEVGAYKGGSSKLICEAKGKKTFHVFDTFEGLPEISSHDNAQQFTKGEFPSSLEEVTKLFSPYSDVHLYKGYFPATSGPIEHKKFSFVHLDVDLHDPTRDSLAFFYPRMSPGGVIISHDYGNAPGVRKAIDDFFKDKPEPVFEFLAGNQCMIVKVG